MNKENITIHKELYEQLLRVVDAANTRLYDSEFLADQVKMAKRALLVFQGHTLVEEFGHQGLKRHPSWFK